MQLHPFQAVGAAWLATRRHAYLADEPGLGKTAQALAALNQAGARRALIICPAIVCGDWMAAYPVFAPSRTVHEARTGPLPATGDIVISYDRAVIRRAELRAMRYDALILDEAHAVKNPTTRRGRVTLNPIQHGRGSLAECSSAVWLLSGTPMPNNPSELWPALRSAGLFAGRQYDFIAQYCDAEDTPFGQRITGGKNLPALRQLLAGYMLRRLKRAVLRDLPPLTVGTIRVTPAEIDPANPILPTLRQLDRQAAAAIDAAIAAGDWSMTSVPHIATIRRLTGLAKAARVVDQARSELDLWGDKLVIFGLHTDAIGHIARELRTYSPILLTGDIPHAKRRAGITKFQTDPTCRVAIGQIKAAGAGITLTASARLLMAEAAWTPADNEQAIMRVHRIGQHRPTYADYVTLAGSSDERVTAALRRKSATARALLDNALAD